MTGIYPRTRLRFLAEFNPPVPPSVRSVGDVERRVLPMDAIHEFAPPSQGDTRPASSLLSGYSYLEPTDIAYAKVTPCFENGKGLVGSDLDGPTFATTEVTVLRPTQGTNQRFLAYLLQSTNFRSPAIASMTGAGGLKRVSESLMKDLMVPSPSSDEQRQIADYLDRETAEIDAFITELNDLKSLLLIRRRTTIDDAFENTRAPAVALKYLGEINSGLTLGKKYEGPTQEFPYLRVANVQAGRVDLKNITTVSVPLTVAANSLLRAGDVLITEGGDRDKLGRGALWQGEIDPILHQNHIFSFRCNSKLLPEYLVYGLESTPARIYFDHTARQSTNLASTNSAIVKNFRLPAPPVGNQEKVLDHLHHELTEMQEMLSNADRVIDLARERRAALITAAVTGQIDVTAKNKPAAEQLEDDIAQGLHKESQ